MRSGGRYETGKGGRIRQTEAPTRDHPDGGAPRDAAGNRMDRPAPDTPPGASGQEG